MVPPYDERGVVSVEERVDGLREPARVSELEGVLAGGKRLERGLEYLVVSSEVRWTLPQDRL